MNWADWLDAGEWQGSREPLIHIPSTVAAEVLPLAIDPDVSVLKLTKIIAKDQVLATQVLRLANSASRAPLHEVTTINDAIVRMGTSVARNVMFAVWFASRMHPVDVYGMRGRTLADHAIGTAYLARMVAEQADVDEDEAFMHGLLHDIGKLLLLQLANEFSRLGHRLPPLAEMDNIMQTRHAHLGAELMSQWGLPVGLCEPVRHHHDPAATVEYRDEAAVIYLADRLSYRYGFGCPANLAGADDVFLQDPECVRFHITAAWLARADERAPALFEIARHLAA
jgi:putative nucleotidyltransferase with HDIG domain